MIPIFHGKAENGKLFVHNKERYQQYIQSLSGEIEIKIGRKKKHRSLNQNDYFHGVICKLIGDELGYTLQEIKGILKFLHLPPRTGTSDLSTVEMEDFHAKCRMWAASEHGIIIPSPNEISLWNKKSQKHFTSFNFGRTVIKHIALYLSEHLTA